MTTIYKPHLKNLRVGFAFGTPDASSSIQLDDTTTGFLPNRVTTTQMNAIVSPATGLMVYNTSTNLVNVYNGTAWAALEASGTAPGNVLFSTANALTATGTTRANALALTADVNVLTSVPSSTGVILPVSQVGMSITIFNLDGANTVKIYAAGSDTIDTVAGATGVTLTIAHRAAEFYCVAAATWRSTLLGAVSS